MLCTSCHEKVKPVVAVDIDGTLGDYHQDLIGFAEVYYGQPFSRDYIGQFLEFSDWFEIQGLSKEDYRQLKLAYRQGGLKRNMPVFPDAAYFLRSLRHAGVEVWLCTTRPYLRLDNVDPDTREWLRRNDMTYDGLLFGDDKYEKLVETVGKDRIVGVVEDLPESFDAALGLGLPVWQIFRKHNTHHLSARSPLFKNLGHARRILTEKAFQWMDEHTSLQV